MEGECIHKMMTVGKMQKELSKYDSETIIILCKYESEYTHYCHLNFIQDNLYYVNRNEDDTCSDVTVFKENEINDTLMDNEWEPTKDLREYIKNHRKCIVLHHD